jgi:hypothetical protein
VLAAPGERSLHFGGAGKDPVRHRHPGEGSSEQLDQLVSIRGGAGGVEQLQLNDGAHRHQPGGYLLLPAGPHGRISKEANQSAGIEQKPDRRHVR